MSSDALKNASLECPASFYNFYLVSMQSNEVETWIKKPASIIFCDNSKREVKNQNKNE